MIFNIVTGKPKVATITVTAPAGTVVTCSLSPYSLSATVSSTSVSFVAPKIGTWTISATYGGVTKTSSVSVTTYNGSYSTSFTFSYYLFKAGEGKKVNFNTNANVSIGTDSILFKATNSGGGYGNYRPNIVTADSIDISAYSTLCFDYLESTSFGSTTNFKFGIYTSSSATSGTFTASADLGTPGTRRTTTLDISSYSGSYYIKVYSTDSGSYSSALTMLTGYNLYLSQ